MTDVAELPELPIHDIARGQYVKNRVFFADEQTAVTAGYRPCAVCLPDEYAQSKAAASGIFAKSCRSTSTTTTTRGQTYL